jgi:hypothetical protein
MGDVFTGPDAAKNAAAVRAKQAELEAAGDADKSARMAHLGEPPAAVGACCGCTGAALPAPRARRSLPAAMAALPATAGAAAGRHPTHACGRPAAGSAAARQAGRQRLHQPAGQAAC